MALSKNIIFWIVLLVAGATFVSYGLIGQGCLSSYHSITGLSFLESLAMAFNTCTYMAGIMIVVISFVAIVYRSIIFSRKILKGNKYNAEH